MNSAAFHYREFRGFCNEFCREFRREFCDFGFRRTPREFQGRVFNLILLKKKRRKHPREIHAKSTAESTAEFTAWFSSKFTARFSVKFTAGLAANFTAGMVANLTAGLTKIHGRIQGIFTLRMRRP